MIRTFFDIYSSSHRNIDWKTILRCKIGEKIVIPLFNIRISSRQVMDSIGYAILVIWAYYWFLICLVLMNSEVNGN